MSLRKMLGTGNCMGPLGLKIVTNTWQRLQWSHFLTLINDSSEKKRLHCCDEAWSNTLVERTKQKSKANLGICFWSLADSFTYLVSFISGFLTRFFRDLHQDIIVHFNYKQAALGSNIFLLLAWERNSQFHMTFHLLILILQGKFHLDFRNGTNTEYRAGWNFPHLQSVLQHANPRYIFNGYIFYLKNSKITVSFFQSRFCIFYKRGRVTVYAYSISTSSHLSASHANIFLLRPSRHI